jgi:hypothetical protein
VIIVDFGSFGKMILVTGLMLVVIGALLMLLGKWPSTESGWGWLGRLPGDIYIKRDNFSFYFPITTSILLSILASCILYLFMKR